MKPIKEQDPTSNLCSFAVLDQRIQNLAVYFYELFQHRAVILHQELLLGHLHSTLQRADVLQSTVQRHWPRNELKSATERCRRGNTSVEDFYR